MKGLDLGAMDLVLAQHPTPPATKGGEPGIGATIMDSQGMYRYVLTRSWGAAMGDDTAFERGPVWIMLNPSTATAAANDATVRKCAQYTRRWGHSAFMVLNVCALRTRSPQYLAHTDSQQGRHNVDVVRALLLGRPDGSPTVAAWGAWADHPAIVPAAYQLLDAIGGRVRLQCLGLTDRGQPKHPLYRKLDQELIPYDWRGTHRALQEAYGEQLARDAHVAGLQQWAGGLGLQIPVHVVDHIPDIVDPPGAYEVEA